MSDENKDVILSPAEKFKNEANEFFKRMIYVRFKTKNYPKNNFLTLP